MLVPFLINLNTLRNLYAECLIYTETLRTIAAKASLISFRRHFSELNLFNS
jgi:hypothetical protein